MASRILAYVLVAGLVVLALGGWPNWPSLYQPTQSAHVTASKEPLPFQPSNCSENSGGPHCSQKKPTNVTSPQDLNDRLARYTLWLAIFTCALVLVSATQIGFLYRSDQSTRIAAEAAKKSAEAAQLSANASVRVDLPALNVENITTAFTIDDFGGDYKKWLDYLILKVSIKNYGRSPAFVSDVIVNAAIADVLPHPRAYTRHVQFPDRFVIASDKEHLFEEYAHYRPNAPEEDRPFTTQQAAMVADSSGFFRVYGVIRYQDFLDNEHERGFIFLWVGKSSKSFIPIYDAEYHYQT